MRLLEEFTPERVTDAELMDDMVDRDALASNLADLRRVNRFLGGSSLTLRGLQTLTASLPPGATLRVLDVATGGADIPVKVGRWAADRGLDASIVGLDRNPTILQIAAENASFVELVHGDATALPFEDDSFDVALCSLALHHFDVDQAIVVLSEMSRVARRGIVVNDLIRCWHGYVGALVLGRVATREPVTRHDGLLSVRRAYTRSELLELLRRAGMKPLRIEGMLGFRIAIAAASV